MAKIIIGFSIASHEEQEEVRKLVIEKIIEQEARCPDCSGLLPIDWEKLTLIVDEQKVTCDKCAALSVAGF